LDPEYDAATAAPLSSRTLMETDMPDRRLTPLPVCVIAASSVLLFACAGHTPPVAQSGDVQKPVAQAGTSTPSALAELTKASVVPANVRSLPNDLLIGVRLNQTLSTTKPEGFSFSTNVVDPVKAKNGAVVVPTTAIIRGVVSAIRGGSATQPPVLCLKLDFLELNGRSYGIRSTVKDVLVNNVAMRVLPHDSLAKVFANEPGPPLKGTGIELQGAAGEGAELPAGTMLVVELDSTLALVATPVR
jgi:hypothetical protein